MSTATPEVDVRQTTIESIDLENLTNTDHTDGTNKDNLRHIVRPADNPHINEFMKNPKGQDVVDIAMIRRLVITTLCGHKFIPSNSPEGRDTCDTCIAMASAINSAG